MALQTLGGKKITIETEKENVHFTHSMSEKWTGDYWIDGKKIYVATLTGTADTVKSKLQGMGITYLIGWFGNMESVYDNRWPIPNAHSDKGYSINFYQVVSTKEPRLTWGSYFNGSSKTNLTVFYTK